MNNEQKIIKNFFLPLAKNKESLELKNDAAFFQKEKLVVSSDMMIEDRHFDKSYDPLILSKKLLFHYFQVVQTLVVKFQQLKPHM